MNEELLNRIEINPRIMLGKPVIKGTRIPVEMILRKLFASLTDDFVLRAENIPIDEILADYPRLTREDVQAALAYAAEALGTERKNNYDDL